MKSLEASNACNDPDFVWDTCVCVGFCETRNAYQKSGAAFDLQCSTATLATLSAALKLFLFMWMVIVSTVLPVHL